MDVDLDGLPDILATTGHFYDATDLDGMDLTAHLTTAERRRGRDVLSVFPPLAGPNMAFHNRGDLTFEEVGKQWGFVSPLVSQGMALADLAKLQTQVDRKPNRRVELKPPPTKAP